MRLTRLKIIRHRWCAPTELILGAKRQLVLGKNGTGKTKLLELIAKICRARPKELMEDPLEVEADFVGSDSRIRVTIKSTREHVGVEPNLGGRLERVSQVSKLDVRAVIDLLGETPETFEMAGNESFFRMITPVLKLGSGKSLLDVVPTTEEHRFYWGSGEAGLFDRLVEVMYSTVLSRSKGTHVDSADLWLSGWFYRYDEQLGAFNALTSGTLKQRAFEDSYEGSEYTGIVGFTDDSEDLYDLVGETPKASKAFGTLPDYLSRTGKMLGYPKGGLDMRVAEVIDEYPVYEITFDSPRFYFFTGVGQTKFYEQDLSFGEKRVLSFMAYLNANPHVIIADELMNGLHHSLGVALLNEIGDRQAFLATHEPVLMDEVDFESADELRRSLLLCRRNPDPKGPPFVWTQLSPEEAADVFPYYPKSLMHGSQILKHWELW